MDTRKLVGWRGPDGLGFFYTHIHGHNLNVRQEGIFWVPYVDGDRLPGNYLTRDDAQAAAVTLSLGIPEAAE